MRNSQNTYSYDTFSPNFLSKMYFFFLFYTLHMFNLFSWFQKKCQLSITNNISDISLRAMDCLLWLQKKPFMSVSHNDSKNSSRFGKSLLLWLSSAAKEIPVPESRRNRGRRIMIINGTDSEDITSTLHAGWLSDIRYFNCSLNYCLDE